MNEYTFNVGFTEFAPIYNGLTDVWIGDGTLPVRKNSQNKWTGGVAGFLYAAYHDASWQELGFVSDYEQAKQYFSQLGITLTYAQWVALLAATPANAQAAQTSATNAEASNQEAESWAKGTKDGTAVPSTDAAYHNNSKYWAEQSKGYTNGKDLNNSSIAAREHDNAEYFKDQASASATLAADSESNAASSASAAQRAQGLAEDAQSAAETAQGLAEDAQQAAETAQSLAETAQAAAEAAQSASETAQGLAEDAQEAAETAQGLAETAQANAESEADDAEAWAVGKRNGSDVPSTDDTYHNNSKYYSEQAGISATNAEASMSHYPRIANNKNWEVWDVANSTWTDTGSKSFAEATVTYAYAKHTSGTTPPSSGWSDTPDPEAGRWLWIKIVYTWTTGFVDTQYIVSYIGANGSGAVNSVNTQSGAVVLDAGDITMDKNAAEPVTIAAALTPITTAQIDTLF